MNLEHLPDVEKIFPEYTKEDMKNVAHWAGTRGFIWGMACMLFVVILFVAIFI